MDVTPEARTPRRSGKAVFALALGMCSLVASPVLIFLPYLSLIWLATASSEQGESLLAQVIPLVVFIILVALAAAGPVVTLVLSSRASRDIWSAPNEITGAGLVLTCRLLAGAALGVLLGALVFYVLSATGVCSLSGCG